MDEKIINEAMDNRFDGVEDCVIVEELLELEAENKRLKEENRWIPVSEKPELFDVPHPHSEEVLIFGVEGMKRLIGWFEKDRGWRYGDGTIEVFPTLWKPIILPKP